MYDVVTVGTATKDVFITSPEFKILRDREHLTKIGFSAGEAECFAFGAKVEVDRPVFAVGGGAANAAVTFSRLGMKTGIVCRLGDDDFGNAISNEIKKEKVSLISLKRDQKEGTGYATILLNKNGERTILAYRGATDNLKDKDFNPEKARARWFYFAPGGISFSVVAKIIESVKKTGAKIAMNPSRRYLKIKGKILTKFLRMLDVVIVNTEEASLLTGFSFEKRRLVFRKFDDLVSGIAVVTNGANGAWVSDGRNLYKAGTFKEKRIVDRTGAGDAFGSGFVAGFMDKSDVCYALRLASANATSVVESVGAQTGILKRGEFDSRRWKYLDLDVEPL